MTYTRQRAHEIAGEFSIDELAKLISLLRQLNAERIRTRYKARRTPEPKPVARRGPNTRITITDIDGNGVQSCTSDSV